MSSSIEILESEVLQLPPSDRAYLVEKLIASLDLDPEIEEAWALEVQRRLAGIVDGSAGFQHGESSLEKLRSEFQ